MANTLIALQEVLFAGYRFTPQVNEIGEAMTTESLDATTLGNTTRLMEPGLKGYGFSGGGLWASPTPDANVYDNLRTRNVPVSLLLTDGTAGTKARSHKATVAQWQIGPAAVGELLPVKFGFGAMAAPVNGNVLYNASATGNVTGTAFQLGAVSATQFLYGILHVFSGTGSFIGLIQSDNAEGFPSPTTRLTFATVATGTPSASEWAVPIGGAITDDWWRISVTNPNTRDFAIVAAIQ
jgi:hypothetical protein